MLIQIRNLVRSFKKLLEKQKQKNIGMCLTKYWYLCLLFTYDVVRLIYDRFIGP